MPVPSLSRNVPRPLSAETPAPVSRGRPQLPYPLPPGQAAPVLTRFPWRLADLTGFRVMPFTCCSPTKPPLSFAPMRQSARVRISMNVAVDSSLHSLSTRPGSRSVPPYSSRDNAQTRRLHRRPSRRGTPALPTDTSSLMRQHRSRPNYRCNPLCRPRVSPFIGAGPCAINPVVS